MDKLSFIDLLIGRFHSAGSIVPANEPSPATVARLDRLRMEVEDLFRLHLRVAVTGPTSWILATLATMATTNAQ